MIHTKRPGGRISIGAQWPRFRISTLLLSMAIVAVLLAWQRDRARYERRILELQHPNPRWDTEQVTGPPDTKGWGDIPTAWASKTPDGQAEWLVLEYDTKVAPRAVIIHETFNPGAVVKVTAFDAMQPERVLWQGTDPTPTTAPRGVSRIPVGGQGVQTSRIKVYIDSVNVPGWNEIDAVGLEDTSGNVHWAQRAYSSTAYGRHDRLPTTTWSLGRYVETF